MGEFPDDPVYSQARREAGLVLTLWACCFLYTVPFCYLTGYLTHASPTPSFGPSVDQLSSSLDGWDRNPDSLTTPLGLGIPDWVFYGVALPWVGCIIITFWFCLFYFREDDLGAGKPAKRS